MVPFIQTRLTTSLAVWIGLLILIASTAHAEKASGDSGLACASDYRMIGSDFLRPLGRLKLRSFQNDLPEIKDPVEFVISFRKKRTAWNEKNPLNRNNFPVPELEQGADSTIRLLRKIKRPAANRAAAEDYIRKIQEIKKEGLPYRDSIVTIHEASEVLALKHPKPGEARLQVFSVAKFRRDNQTGIEVFKAMMENDIFIVTGHPQTVDGLAESTFLGTRALEVVERNGKIDRIWMNPRERLEHDVAHAMMPTRDKTTAAILNLPLATRVEILHGIEKLSRREQHLARYAIYQTAHEPAEESAIPRLYQTGAYRTIQIEYRETMGLEINAVEARWIQEWYRENIGQRIAPARD